jgi:hypothetical protein
MKQCPNCNQLKPASEYHTLPHTSDGLNWRCISCQNAYNREYQRKRSLAKCDPRVLEAIKFAPYERVTRFARKVKVLDSGCWQWTGNCHPDNGYGRLWFDRHDDRLAHRLAYEWSVGPIPVGLVIDHLCRHRSCVNPDHMEPVTSAVNTMRGVGIGPINAAKTHCLRGHLFDFENTYVVRMRNGNTGRSCKECSRIRKRERRHLKNQLYQSTT